MSRTVQKVKNERGNNNNMQYLKKNFVDTGFLLLRSLYQIKKMLSFYLFNENETKNSTDVFCFKNEANKLSASNFAWVFGDGIVQCIHTVSFVNNPSPLTHENIKWRCSRGH